MKKQYVTPESEVLNLFLEGEVAINIASQNDDVSIEKDAVLSNKKQANPIWGNSLWGEEE